MTEITKDIPTTDYRSLRDEESRITYELLQDYRSARSAWFNDRVEFDRFFHNMQYSKDEEEEIKKRGQAPVVINITYALVKQIIALATSASPIWQVDPVADSDKDTAYTLRRLLDSTWYNSKGNRKLSQIIKGMSSVGVGYGSVTPTTGRTFGMNFAHIPYTQVYIDPSTAEFDYNDAEAQIIAKVISVKRAAELLGKTEDEIKEYRRTYRYVDSDESGRAQKYQKYTRPIRGENSVFVVQRMQFEKKDVFFVEPANNRIDLPRKTYFEVPDHVRRLEAGGIARITKLNRKVLAKYITVGSHTSRYYLPIDRYTMVPFINEFNDNPYPLGDIDFIYGIQRAINKYVLLSILNATLANNMKVIAPEGAIPNIDEWEKRYSVPGAVLTYQWKPDMPKPEQFNPLPMSSEFFAMPRTMIQIMEYVTGMFGVLQGNPQGAPDTASGLISLQSYGGQKVKLLIRNAEEALQSLGDVAIQLFQNYAPYDQIMTYYNQQSNENESIRYNSYEFNEGKLRIKNDLSAGEFSARVNVVTNYGGERQIKAKVLSDLAAQTGSPMLMKPILKLLDIQEADEIVDQIDQLEQANQTIEQLQQQLERLEQVNRQLENQVLQKAQNVEVSKFSAELDKIKNKIEKEYGVKMANEFANIKNQ